MPLRTVCKSTTFATANVLVNGRPPQWLIVARCFRPVRSTCSWATAYARALARRAARMRAEANRWRNEARPLRADNRARACAEAAVFEPALPPERETVVTNEECGGWVSAAGAAAAARHGAKQWTAVERSHCPETQ